MPIPCWISMRPGQTGEEAVSLCLHQWSIRAMQPMAPYHGGFLIRLKKPPKTTQTTKPPHQQYQVAITLPAGSGGTNNSTPLKHIITQKALQYLLKGFFMRRFKVYFYNYVKHPA